MSVKLKKGLSKSYLGDKIYIKKDSIGYIDEQHEFNDDLFLVDFSDIGYAFYINKKYLLAL
jgi:hypothetical protein